jgi:hypothetical protein
VSEDVAADLALAALNKLDVSLHASLGEVLGEDVGDVGIGMKTGELEGGHKLATYSKSRESERNSQ